MNMLRSNARATLGIACLSSLCVLLGGCVETSIVLKVKKDGSGVLHVRSHQQATTFSFAKASKDDEKSKSSLPNQDKLDQMTSRLGKGVKLVSAESSTNRSGWKGYDLIWEFQDVNQLIIDGDFDKFVSDDERAEKTQKKVKPNKPARKPPSVRFVMNDGLLEVRVHGIEPTKPAPKAAAEIGAVDPFADKPLGASESTLLDSVTEEMAIKFLADARAGFFIEVDGEIESTNAKHRQGNLITLMSVNLGELLKDDETRLQIKRMGGDEPPSLQELQALADNNNGLDLDLQNPLRIKIR